MIDNDMVLRIEKALGFKLYPPAIRYINTDEEYMWSGRACGKTIAYMLKIILQKDRTINLKDIGSKHLDSIHNRNYPTWFRHEFMKIRNSLKIEGIEVVRVIDGERLL